MPDAPRSVDTDALLTFEAPYLVEKLQKERIATPDVARVLFRELRRWMLLSVCSGTKKYAMYSRRVDEVWHQFLLFTVEYSSFCEAAFGAYFHHSPRDAPDQAHDGRRAAPFEEFARDYETVFGPLPAEWDDARAVGRDTRLLRSRFRKRLVVRGEEMRAELVLERDPPRVLVTSDARALPALAFVAENVAFYARELPGDLEDVERAALVRALIQVNVLRVAC